MQLNHTNAYSLDQISNEYKQADLQVKGKKQMVTDEEVCIFLNEGHWVWPIVFWGLMIGIFFFLAVMK